jgi:predicted lipoprotein with Yx(FWY)xxD motif
MHAATLAALATTVAVAATSVSYGAPANATSARVASRASITLRASEYGKVIFDARGKVLYRFAADKSPTSTCYGACAKAWPPLLTKGSPRAGADLTAKLLGTTRRKDGSLQVTYNGHPLYHYEGDMGHKIMCRHADMHGGFWYVVKANGTLNLAKSKTKM